MYFVNVNGLRLGPSGGDFSDLCTNMEEAHIDILGLAETKLNTCHQSFVSTYAAASRRTFKFSQVVFASSAVNYNGQFKQEALPSSQQEAPQDASPNPFRTQWGDGARRPT
jgi:exonuclease III